MWHTEPAPAGITVIGLPNLKTHQTDYAIRIPYVLGLISTRSLNGQVIGILDLVATNEERIKSGVFAYDGVEKLKANPNDPAARAEFEAHKADLGYAYLLKRYVADPRTANEALVVKAAYDTIPDVPVMFWAFRVMAGIGFAMIALFATAFVLVTWNKAFTNKLFLTVCVCALPLPWISTEFGWVLSEFGRQPWAVDGVLPTFMGASSLSAGQIWTSIIGFTLMYATLAVIEVRLLIKTVKTGPYAYRFGRMHDDPEVSESASGVVGPAE